MRLHLLFFLLLLPLVASGECPDTFYIGPTGNDNNACTSAARCATINGVTAKANFGPGDMIVVGNGTYTASGGKKLNLNCATNAAKFNGTAAQRITLIAEEERMAKFVNDSSTQDVFLLDNCNYWTVQGLRFEGVDLDNAPHDGSPVRIHDSNNMIIQYNISDGHNRCVNSGPFSVSGANNLVQGNEVYNFTRNNGMPCKDCVIRRDYAHSRSADDPACYAELAGTPTNIGDAGFSFYTDTVQGAVAENNFVEDVSEAFYIGCNVGSPNQMRNIWLYGNVAYSTIFGLFDQARGTTQNFSCSDIHYINNLIIGPQSTGINSRGGPANINGVGTVVIGNTVLAIDAGKGVNSTGANMDSPTDWWGSKNYKIEYYRNLFYKPGQTGTGTGMFIEDVISNGQTGNINEWVRQDNNVFGYATAYTPSGAGTNGTHTGNTTTDPAFGNNRICPPTTSPMYNADPDLRKGASVIYRYESADVANKGNLTNQPLWVQTKPGSCPTSSSGWYPYDLRTCVSGLNDIAGSSYYDIADRVIASSPAQATNVLNSCVADGTYP